MSLTPTPDQARAITAPQGPVLVVAGPGAGKTFCLIARIAHLIRDARIPPERICAVTFTNKAADEISSRLARDLPEGRDIQRGTLHRLCVSLLRAHPEAAGLAPGFGVADEDYQHTVLRRLRIGKAQAPGVLTQWGRFRLHGRPLTEAQHQLLLEYLGHLRRRNLIDFDDILVRTRQLLLDHPAVRKAISGRWDALLVDEFQDLNATSYEVVRLLGAGHRNVFAVGDEEQSIYGWAGADPTVLRAFQRDFGVGAPIVLERNHRTARQIFEAARRILRANPQLFDKPLRAERESAFGVEAMALADETEEARWIVADVRRDREAHGTPWHEVAVLFRTHATAVGLEQAFLEAGLPIRLARGRSLADDPVIAEVLGALRILTAPQDTMAVEALARRVLPEPLVQRAMIEAGTDGDLLTGLRLVHRRRKGDDRELRQAMRFVYHVENLPALARGAATVGDLVDALLAARPGTGQGVLEERSDDLPDPRDLPDAVSLAADLARVKQDGGAVGLQGAPAMSLALEGMLRAAGIPARSVGPDHPVGPHDLLLASTGDSGLGPRLFRALQLLAAPRTVGEVRDCVTFDIEATDKDVDSCAIVELAAARVRGGRVVETFTTLVHTDQPISVEATRTHGYTKADLVGAPSFTAVWPAFRAFVGQDLLVAHNGLAFDVPVLRRHVEAAGLPWDVPPVYDSLPEARALFKGSAGLQGLAQRFGVETGRAHHALDDAIALAGVLVGLGAARTAKARKTAFAQGLDWLGLALALEPPAPHDVPGNALLEICRWYTLSRYGRALDAYQEALPGLGTAPAHEDLIGRLGGMSLYRSLRRTPSLDQRFPEAMRRLQHLLSLLPTTDVTAGALALLELAALARAEGDAAEHSRVSLLTLHATKGLEFSRVYIVGVEDYQMPGYHAITKKLEDDFPEARRTLYVGMTRARDRLVLTRVDHREGKPSGGSRFLEELELVPTDLRGWGRHG